MDSVLNKLRGLDAYPKVNEDFYRRTLSGGVITVCASVIIFVLVVSEFVTDLFLRTKTTNELMVDSSRGDKLEIALDFTLHAINCDVVSLDTMDVSGELHLDTFQDVYKVRLHLDGKPLSEPELVDPHVHEESVEASNGSGTLAASGRNGTACGSCYGAEDYPGQCCNTCEEVRVAYNRRGWALLELEDIEQCVKSGYTNSMKNVSGEGCRFFGTVSVNRVAGNFHFAPGKSFQQGSMHVHDLVPFGNTSFNFSHTINRLQFGDSFPGAVNQLDGQSRIMTEPGSGIYQYFVKIVPTTYQKLRGKAISTNQFSVTEQFQLLKELNGKNLPGVFVVYDVSPIKVRFSERKLSLVEFLTSICAIVGGVFTVSSIIDGFWYHGTRAIRKKMEIGKLS